MTGAGAPPWGGPWRDQAWSRLGEPWDVLVIGGGITGAALLAEAAHAGWRALLLEQRDFAWGTSSRSSKLVHGGLRYLRQGQIGLTRHSVQERRRLIAQAPGLVEPLDFLLATRRSRPQDRFILAAGLALYDLLGGQWTHRRLGPAEFRRLAPEVDAHGLDGGFQYLDARTDDARLTLRVIREGVAAGGLALNYAAVEGLLRAGGRVAGVRVRDVAGGRTAEVQARVVVSATGAWADRLRGELGARPRVRPLRGSHLTFPAARVPVTRAHMAFHPRDRRPLFVIPWEGVTLFGTTDLDHRLPLDEEPAISAAELEYLMEGARAYLPSLGLTPADALASFCGVRPVIGSGQADPSRETRDHVVWEEGGLVTVTGGKLTTFRLIARDALRAAGRHLPPPRGAEVVTFAGAGEPPAAEGLDPAALRRLAGRLGTDAAAALAAARPGELQVIPGTETLWAELRFAARAEGVVHLEDLLLRRTRLGLQQADGGAALLPRVRALAQAELGWDDARWAREAEAYLALWRAAYSVPR